MEIFLTHDHYDKTHLEDVKAEMIKLGAPTIRVFDMGEGMYAAIEGCHRLRAAAALGVTPEIEILDYDALADIDVTDEQAHGLGLDLDNPGTTFAQIIDGWNWRKSFVFEG